MAEKKYGEKVFSASVEALKKEMRSLGDTNFVQDELYFFRLRIPDGVTADGKAATFTTPLMVNPQSITLSEPFAMTPTATIGGGLFIEEEGVIAKQLRITGTTGFKRRLPPPGEGWGAPLPHNCNNWRISSTEKTLAAGKRASGQRQFQFLQDRVFRLYSQLKKNPETSQKTYLTFHIPKDGEHYQVVPINFTLQRAVPRSTMYFYDIQMLVIGPAAGAMSLKKQPFKKEPSRQSLSKANSLALGCIQRLRNSLQELNDAVGDIQGTFNSVNTVIKQVEALVEATAQAISGLVSIIALPATVAAQLIDSVNAMIPLIENWGGLRPGFYNIIDAVSDLGRSLERSAIALREFDASVPQSRLDQIGKNWNSSSNTASAVAANSLQGLLNQGTGPQAGDAARDRGNPVSPRPGGNLSGTISTQEVTVFQNDSLSTIAARSLGDSERSSELAALNNLRPPYISNTGMPGTLRPGDIILVPSRQSASVVTGPIGPTVLGARPSDPIAIRTLGTDLKLDPISGVVGEPLYDFVLAGSTTDIVAVSGVDNLKQGLRSRILTELGENSLFPSVGVERMIGLNASDFRLNMEQLALVSAVEADERIVTTQNVQVSQPTPDSLVVDFDATVINLQDQVQVRIAK